MIDIIKQIDINGKINTKDLFSLLKTKSEKSNKVIYSKLKSFNKFPDFLDHYLNHDFYINFHSLHDFINNISNNDDTISSLGTNIDQYISSLTKIILLSNLLLEAKDVLNKILISSKEKLNALKIKNKIESLNQENLFNLIDIFLNTSQNDFRKSSSTLATISNIPSLDLDSYITSFQNDSSEKEEKKFIINDEIYDDSLKTPGFEEELSTIIEEQIEELSENNRIDKKSSVLTLSKYVFADEENINKKNKENQKENQEENDNNRLQNLLKMILKLYRKKWINSEEKIKLKKMVIDKSLKIAKFYYDIYQNPNTDKEKGIKEIKKLLD